MKIRLKNLGILKQAEFSVGELTVICGENNTGKSYTAYALYGFLNSWREYTRFPVSDTEIQRLLKNPVINIDLTQYVEMADDVLASACKRYASQLDSVFSAREGRFRNSEFAIQIGKRNDILEKEYKGTMEFNKTPAFDYIKNKGSEELTILQGLTIVNGREIGSQVIEDAIRSIIGEIVIADSLPRPFIASTERTGVAIFKKELNFARNQLLHEMTRADQKTNPGKLLFKAFQSYPLPIGEDVDFIRQLEDIVKRKSFVAKEYPEVLEDLDSIIGGDYNVLQYDQLYYVPKGTQLRLTMDQSSSAVRSLVNIYFYLRHIAHKGDLLMVDEPELNLHPANQRRIARLLARLVNLGVKVFITTHSDYIVKELNTLIMLNHDKPHLKRIAEENGYRQSELIRSDQVKVYMAQEALMPLEEGQKRRRRGYTLVEADIDPELGIEAPSFDETIDDMNRIQKDIVWGAE